MFTIFHFDPISPNFLGSRSERERLRKFNVDTSQNFSQLIISLLGTQNWYPSLQQFTFTAVHFRPKVWSNVAANRSTHCTVRSHSTKSCSFPVLTLAQFFHLTALKFCGGENILAFPASPPPTGQSWLEFWGDTLTPRKHWSRCKYWRFLLLFKLHPYYIPCLLPPYWLYIS